MPKQKASDFEQLGKELERTIRKMKKLQKAMAADMQPASMREIDQLTSLGRRYGELVSEMEAFVAQRAGGDVA